MKKIYIAPELDVTIVDAQAIIATSNSSLPSGGSNKITDGPTKAESKLYDYDDYFDIDW